MRAALAVLALIAALGGPGGSSVDFRHRYHEDIARAAELGATSTGSSIGSATVSISSVSTTTTV